MASESCTRSGWNRSPAVACCVLAAACNPIREPCFTPPTDVKDVRILAVATDPPEARVNLATGIADPVTLRALIVIPGREAPPAHVSWDLCPATDDPGCPPGSTVATNPEWGADSSVQVMVSSDLIARSIAADPLHGLRDVRVRAVIHVEEAQPSSASALLFFSFQPGPLNRAPVIAGLRAGRDGKPLLDLNPGNLFLGMSEQHTTAIRPVLAPEAVEEYDSVSLTGDEVHLRERITYSFFADETIAMGRGLVLKEGAIPIVVYQGLDDFEADEPDPGTPDTPDGLFDAVPVHAGGSVGKIWIVARDSRGATSWISVPYSAAEQRPQCLGPPPHQDCPELQFGCL